MDNNIILILVILAALWYDFVNGFHDAANAIATTVSTRALSPRQAIILARTLNFIGALLHTSVAYTIGKGVVDSTVLTLPIVFAALLGAIAWGYFTWYFGLPSSSTHALIGGMIGVSLFANDFSLNILMAAGLKKIVIAMVLSPLVGFIAGGILLTVLSWSAWHFPFRKTNHIFKKVQIGSAMFMSYSHGMNDAQNAMGIITIALVSAGTISEFNVPLWVRIASALAIGLGTSVGGWRIIKTMGTRITKLKAIDGCTAESSAGAVIYAASSLGIPISTTHVISSAIMGSAAVGGIRNLRWKVVRQIITAWFLTIPGAGLFGIISYLIINCVVH